MKSQAAILLTASAFLAAVSIPALAEPGEADENFVLTEQDSLIGNLRTSLSNVQTARIDLGSEASFKDRSGEKKPGFLYFRAEEAPGGGFQFKSRWLFEATSAFTPRQSSAASTLRLSPGESWVLRGFTPRSAAAEISLSYGAQPSELGRRPRFDVSVSSNVSISEIDIPGLVNNPSLSQALSRQSYEFGVNIGYAGFGVEAGLRRENSVLNDGYSGYDLGLFYEGHRFYTNILVGEHRRQLAGLQRGFGADDLSYYSLQVGASYRLGSALDLTGGFRLIGYGKGYVFEADRSSLDRIFYLGTRLNF
jgi:hypothetical protein